MALLFLSALTGTSAGAAQLKPETDAAFQHYVSVTEAQMDDDVRLNRFLVIDRLPDFQRKQAYDQLQQGEVYIEELHTRENQHPIHIPSGLIHHWVGVIFVPNSTASQVEAVLHDYDDEAEIYKPDIRKAKLIEQNGDDSKIYLQFYSRTIVTVVLNAYFTVVEKQLGAKRIQSVSRSTRVAEVANWDGPDEHERPDGGDHGYMWRLNSYWRIEEKDGGAYVENESITLTRTVPPLLEWLIGPLTKSIPHDVLVHTLTNTRKAVVKAETPVKQEVLSQETPVRKELPQKGSVRH
jgi:hypothetical protein